MRHSFLFAVMLLLVGCSDPRDRESVLYREAKCLIECHKGYTPP